MATFVLVVIVTRYFSGRFRCLRIIAWAVSQAPRLPHDGLVCGPVVVVVGNVARRQCDRLAVERGFTPPVRTYSSKSTGQASAHPLQIAHEAPVKCSAHLLLNPNKRAQST